MKNLMTVYYLVNHKTLRASILSSKISPLCYIYVSLNCALNGADLLFLFYCLLLWPPSLLQSPSHFSSIFVVFSKLKARLENEANTIVSSKRNAITATVTSYKRHCPFGYFQCMILYHSAGAIFCS